MARFTLTLTLGDLSLTLKPPLTGWQRSIVSGSKLTLKEYSPNGSPIFTGYSPTVFAHRYTWNFSADVSEGDSLILDIMARDQTPTSLVQLQDEYSYLDPEQTPTRTFVDGSEIAIATDWTTGFFQGNVWLDLPENHKQIIGNHSCDVTLTNTFVNYTFTAIEIL